MSKPWFCLNCKKFINTYVEILKGFSVCCRECGSTRLMKMENIKDKEFEKLVKEFKDQTESLS